MTSGDEMSKNNLWLMVADRNQAGLALAIPTIAWIAQEAGVDFETYIENKRSGVLFAKTGSTVLGGRHYNDFNYLNNIYDIKYIFFGNTLLFRSSAELFGCEILVDTDDLVSLYTTLMEKAKNSVNNNPDLLVLPSSLTIDGYEVSPYFYIEIFNRKALAIPVDIIDELPPTLQVGNIIAAYLSADSTQSLKNTSPRLELIDQVEDGDTIGTLSVRMAERWKSWAQGVTFGDPEIIYFLQATNCRERRVSVYAPRAPIPQSQIRVSSYTEEHTDIADDVIRLCKETGNKVMIGRQTCDGDLIYWGGYGVCLQIMDPNRPVFPILNRHPQPWPNMGSLGVYDLEPDDGTLRKWATEGKILTSLLWHSGEVAHTEGMLNVIEFGIITGLKVGIGVHAARYQTCPQLWELSSILYEKGGALGLIEPLLYSGGMGIMGERNCSPEDLHTHCENAMEIIESITGPKHLPKGYYAFYDSDMETFTEFHLDLFEVVSETGMDYFVTTSWPGRNRVVYIDNNVITINHTPRTIFTGSPFVRANITEMMQHCTPVSSPGWLLTAIDSPVHAFAPYIWQKGHHMMAIADYLMNTTNFINVIPHTIARYARILLEEGFLPSVGTPK
jgi:hypothetical protein